jgi:mRNA interferase MazF
VGLVITQYEIWLVNLDPTVGHEIKKTRPCVVISPDEMNSNIQTIIIAPMTSRSKSYPTRISVRLKGKTGYIVLDQIRTLDKSRFIKKLSKLSSNNQKKIKAILKEMLID